MRLNISIWTRCLPVWKFKLKHYKGLPVSSTVLKHYQLAAAIPDSQLTCKYSESEIITEIKNAYHKVRTSQKDHKTLRESYLVQLAEVIVLHQSPSLVTNEATPIRVERVQQKVKQLQRREKQKRMHKRIGHALDLHHSQGLVRVNILDVRAKGSNLGTPDDLKT